MPGRELSRRNGGWNSIDKSPLLDHNCRIHRHSRLSPKKDMRTSIVFIASCVLGVAIGGATAYSALSINGWNPELERRKLEDILREGAEKASNPNAKAFLAERIHDFGIKDVKEKGKHDFVVKNVGTAPLTLVVDQTTCTCTGIDLSTKTIAPGKTAIATVNYDAERAMTGAYNQGGTIVTNDPENREIYLGVKGVFTAPIVLSPSDIYVPSLAGSETKIVPIRFYGFEKELLTLETPQWTDREHFDISIAPAELTEQDRENSLYKNATTVYEGTVTIKPGLPVGAFQERFYVKSNYASQPSAEFFVRGQIRGGAVSIAGSAYRKDTGTAVLGKTSVGQKISRDLSVQFSGTSAVLVDLKIKAVTPAWLNVTLTEPRDMGNDAARRRFYTLTIELPATAPVSNYYKSDAENVATITLETGLDDMPVIKIPVQFAVEQ